MIERRMEIDKFHSCHASHRFNGLLYLVVPQFGARCEAMVVVADGREMRYEDAHLWVHLSQGVDEMQIIGYKLIAVIGPVAWVGVVDAEMHHSDIGCERLRCVPLSLLEIRHVAVCQQCGRRPPEVSHLIGVAQHTLQLRRIRVVFAVFDACSVGDAVSHARHLQFFLHLRSGAYRK